MIPLNRYTRRATLLGFCLGAVGGVNAQVSSINSVVVSPRVYNDVPGATITTFTSYPSVVFFNEQNVSQPGGFANRDAWKFSADSGTTPYQLQHNDYFSASMNLTLSGSPIAPRKEAGFLFNTANEGDIQFIVNTDGHEVVQFGGISFYSFSGNNVVSYNSGDSINLGMNYFQDGNGKNALQFFADGNASPVFEFGPGVGSGAADIGDGSTLGGYFQIVNDPNNANNSGSASFNSLTITPVPEPSTLGLLSLGAISLGAAVLRRRRG